MSTWKNSLKSAIPYTIDKSSNYNVIADLNHGSTSNPINQIYAKGAAHYVVVYGYTGDNVWISDSNPKLPDKSNKYSTPYDNLSV